MRAYLILVAIGLAGCAAQTQYIRADGGLASAEAIESARSACSSESNDSLCMVEKGYFNVPAGQAEAKRAQLAAIVEANEQERQAKLAAQAAAAERARDKAIKEKLSKKKRKPSTASSAWPLR